MLTITLKNNSPREQLTKEMLEGILQKYDIDKWILCKEVLIEHGIRPHSWPVVTLNTPCDTEECLLRVFLHEQAHWVEERDEESFDKAIEALRVLYPEVPVGRPEGSHNEKSTYRHLIVCRLEYHALAEFLGEEVARENVLSNSNYIWIRRKAIEDGDKIDEWIKKYRLHPNGARSA